MRRCSTVRPSCMQAHALAEFALVGPLLFFMGWALLDLGLMTLAQFRAQAAIIQTVRDLAQMSDPDSLSLQTEAVRRLNLRLPSADCELLTRELEPAQARNPLRASLRPQRLILIAAIERPAIFPLWRMLLPEGRWQLRLRATGLRLARDIA